MVKMQTPLGRGFDEGHYPAAHFKNSANYERLKEKYKDNIVYGQQRRWRSICLLILISCVHTIILKQVMQNKPDKESTFK